ncbi:hypothetical protein C2G38_2236677 [Gigaspora rosea]|uniref:Uncharacterized protein n=1 Tax=Gigaspora rosea TaxID=44941 RepID=A0A397TSK2_9GLOM|nr:hypothetical protein C2G38_2236677 [Gigaspora rosea]
MDLDLLLTSTEFSQSDNESPDCYEISNEYETTDMFTSTEFSDNELPDCYETDDEYETGDEYSNNGSVPEEFTPKKKRNPELASHPDVLEILSPLCVRCKHCKRSVKLKRNYDKSRIESHVSNNKCIKNKGFLDLRKFFAVSNSQDGPSNKRYPCSGLCEEKHLKYIERVGGFTISGGAPLAKVVAQELFPDKFTKDTKFSYSKLNSNQSKRLNDELSARSKWNIDQKGLCISSSECEIYTDRIEQNVLSKPIPKPENRRFTPKLYFKNNPILKFLGNLHIKELWTSVSNSNKNNSVPFWLKLAEKGLKGAFESKSTFKGLCEIMMQIAKREDHSKGIQNLKYSENVTHFTAVLSSLSPKAYDFFRANLAGQTLRNIRY